jgi:23S rRNA U2552 (ribose-2'-O)-methylase RlmE/FtsJ
MLAKQFSMVSKERLLGLYDKCKKFKDTDYSFVECGVARGGCLAMMKYAAGPNNKVFGLDSFEDMPDITEKDLGEYNKSNPLTKWGNLSGGIENVYKTFSELYIAMKNVKLIKGFFDATLNVDENVSAMGKIAILRLDGDWYEPTKVCLDKLYSKVIVGGIIIIDDYGHWVGAKRATDEFRTKHNILSPLIKTDYTEHYWVKEETLCELAEKYGVDKCPAIRHTYTPPYHVLLSPLRQSVKTILEIGIGNVPLMKPIVGENYKPGASLRMWRDYFPNANIIGCDILRSVLFNDEDRIKTFFVDQSNESSLVELAKSITPNGNYLDLIIDDGSHIEEHMILSFKTLWQYVKPKGGIYIIEDIKQKSVARFTTVAKELGFTDAELIYTHNGSDYWDGFVAFRRC